MEIITVKDSQGAVLEKRVLTTVSIDAVNGSVTVQGNHIITRVDNVEVQVNSMGGFNIQPAGSTMPGNPDLTEAEIAQIMTAKDTFLNEIKTVLETKAQTT